MLKVQMDPCRVLGRKDPVIVSWKGIAAAVADLSDLR